MLHVKSIDQIGHMGIEIVDGMGLFVTKCNLFKLACLDRIEKKINSLSYEPICLHGVWINKMQFIQMGCFVSMELEYTSINLIQMGMLLGLEYIVYINNRYERLDVK